MLVAFFFCMVAFIWNLMLKLVWRSFCNNWLILCCEHFEGAPYKILENLVMILISALLLMA